METAIGQMEKALTSFDRSLDAKPQNNPVASAGQQQALSSLERMRQQLAQQNAQKSQGQQSPNNNTDPKQAEQNLMSMIMKVKDERRQEEYDASRTQQKDYKEQEDRIFKTW